MKHQARKSGLVEGDCLQKTTGARAATKTLNAGRDVLSTP
jgi:hypothetical protein